MPQEQPLSVEARDHILKTLNFIRCNSEFAGLSEPRYRGLTPNQLRSVNSAYDQLKGTRSSPWRSEIPQMEIPIIDKSLDRHNPTALLGGVVKGEGNGITYSSFSICISFITELPGPYAPSAAAPNKGINLPSCCLAKWSNAKRIVRRFHFDFQPGQKGKPSSHIQYGGTFPSSDHHAEWHYCLEDSLENPRIHYLPMDLALLLDIIIREFETPLRKWAEEPGWNNLVLESQKLWWSEYWDWFKSHIGHGAPTFHQRIYGED